MADGDCRHSFRLVGFHDYCSCFPQQHDEAEEGDDQGAGLHRRRRDRVLYPSGAGVVIAGASPNGQIWRSVDGGYNWTYITDLGVDIWSFVYDKHRGWVWAAVYSTSFSKPMVWYSKDAGKTWHMDSLVGSQTFNQYFLEALGHDLKNDRMFVGYGKQSLAYHGEVWSRGFAPSATDWWD